MDRGTQLARGPQFGHPWSRHTTISSSSHQVKGIYIDKHDFYYLNIPSYIYSKPHVNSSLVVDILSITLL